MKAKIIFEYQYDPIKKTGFPLADFPDEIKVNLTKNFVETEILDTVILTKDQEKIFAIIDVKEEWYDLLPIIGANKYTTGSSAVNNFIFWGSVSLSDTIIEEKHVIHPNSKIKTIRNQLIDQGIL